MAFIYEVNGQRVQFDKEPTEKDIDEAARSLGSVEKPKSARSKPVEGEGGAAFGVYPQAGRRPESQQDREASKDMALQTARGMASSIPALAGIPGSLVNQVANAPRTAQAISNRLSSVQSQLAGNERQPEPQLPEYNQVTPYDMSYFANLTPGPQPSSPAGQLAFGVGQLAGAPLINPAFKMGAEAVKTPINFGKGFARGLAYPEGASPNTALAPMRETFVPHEQVKQFMAGERPASTLTEVPTAPLYQNKPVANWAYGMAPENTAGQKLVPYAGRTAEGVGEQIGSQYRKNPLTGLVDLGATLATGIPAPITAMGRAAPALAARQLQQATQFEPGFGPARAAALQREGQMGLQANMPPTQNLLPAPGPVAPMIASPSGQVTAPGGRPLPTQASGQPVTQPQGPTPQQMAIQRTQEIVAQRQQQPQKVAGPVQPQPLPPQARTPQTKPASQPTPKVEGVRSSSEIRKELDMIGRQSDELHGQGLESGIKYGTPEGESYQAQLGQLSSRARILEKELEQALKAEKTATKQIAKKKAPSNVSQMLTDEQAKMWNTLKQPENISPVEKRISEMTQANRDKLEDSLLNQLMDMDVSRASKELVSQQLNIIGKYRIK